MRRYFSFRGRQNPHLKVADGQIDQISSRDKRAIARGIADLERKVWSKIDPDTIEGAYSFFETLDSGDDVILGVSFAEGADAIGGPYLSYFIAEEVDLDDTGWREVYEDETGEDFDDFIASLPSNNPRMFYRQDQTRDSSPLAKEEHRKLMDDLYAYMEEEGIAFATYARADTTYRLMKAGRQGNMVIVVEERIPDMYGPGDDSYRVMGYYVPPGRDVPGMIRSTRKANL
jgi:hypothetical protein